MNHQQAVILWNTGIERESVGVDGNGTEIERLVNPTYCTAIAMVADPKPLLLADDDGSFWRERRTSAVAFLREWADALEKTV